MVSLCILYLYTYFIAVCEKRTFLKLIFNASARKEFQLQKQLQCTVTTKRNITNIPSDSDVIKLTIWFFFCFCLSLSLYFVFLLRMRYALASCISSMCMFCFNFSSLCAPFVFALFLVNLTGKTCFFKIILNSTINNSCIQF